MNLAEWPASLCFNEPSFGLRLQIGHKTLVAQRPTTERGVGQCTLLVSADACMHQFGVCRLTRERRIAQSPIQRVWGDESVGAPPCVVPVARPCVILRLRHDVRAHGVEVDVGHARQQITIGLNERGAVAPFPQRAGARVHFVEHLHIAAADCLHHLGQTLICLWREQQMQVIAHQHIGVDVDLVHAALLEQQIEHALVISNSAKNVLPVVAPQDDVVRVAGDGETREASHLLMVIRT
jgi:hypothetical protein